MKRLEILFLIAFDLYTFAFYVLKFRGENLFFKVLVLVSYFIVLLIFILKKSTRRDWMIFIFGIILIIITLNRSFIPFLLFILVGKNIENEELFIKNIFFINIVFFILMIISYYNNIIYLPQSESIRIVNGVLKVRKSLGFKNPNTVFLYLTPITISYVYMRYKNWNIILDNGIIIIVYGVLYNLTNSRTGYLMSFILLILILIFKKFNKLINNFITKWILKNLFMIMTVVSLYMTLFLVNDIKINELLSYRPMTWKVYLDLFIDNPFFLISKKLNNGPLDNSFLRLLFLNGIFLWGFINILYRRIVEIFFYEEKRLILLLTYVLIYSCFESIMLALYINILVIVICILFNKEKKKRWKNGKNRDINFIWL